MSWSEEKIARYARRAKRKAAAKAKKYLKMSKFYDKKSALAVFPKVF
jgi:hypothetical protein